MVNCIIEMSARIFVSSVFIAQFLEMRTNLSGPLFRGYAQRHHLEPLPVASYDVSEVPDDPLSAVDFCVELVQFSFRSPTLSWHAEAPD